MSKVQPRNVAPFLQMLRNFLLGRKHTSPLRFEDYYAPRTQPPPSIPDGPSHKLSANFYCLRDGRREVAPPLVIANSGQIKQIEAKKSEKEAAPTSVVSRTPGQKWQWD